MVWSRASPHYVFIVYFRSWFITSYSLAVFQKLLDSYHMIGSLCYTRVVPSRGGDEEQWREPSEAWLRSMVELSIPERPAGALGSAGE